VRTHFFHPRDLDITAPHLFWYAPPDALLRDSLDRFGQLTPGLVLDDGGKPVLAAGARRVAALRETGGAPLAAVVLDPGALAREHPDLPPALGLGLFYLISNQGRAVDEAMLVAAGRYFTAHGSADDFLRLAGPYLFGPGDRRARLVTAWLSLPGDLDPLLASGHLPLAGAGVLARCDPDTLAALTPLLELVRWSRANLDNAVTWLLEAAGLAGEAPAALLARSGALDLAGRELSPNDLTAGLLAALRRLRYPATTTLEARFTTLSRELTRGGRVKLRPSQGFEADTLTVEVTVRRPEDMARAGADLAAMAGHPALPRLLRLAEDGDEPA
jgi:hypothetical protein